MSNVKRQLKKFFQKISEKGPQTEGKINERIFVINEKVGKRLSEIQGNDENVIMSSVCGIKKRDTF